MRTAEELIAQRLSGIQLAIFENIWPIFTWIDHMALRPDGPVCFVHIQSHTKPSDEEWEDVTRLMGELLELASDKDNLQIVFELSRVRPSDKTHVVAMSDTLFKVIASRVAPWRLSAGR